MKESKSEPKDWVKETRSLCRAFLKLEDRDSPLATKGMREEAIEHVRVRPALLNH